MHARQENMKTAGIIYYQLKHCQKTCYFFYLWCNDGSGIM